MVLLFTTDRLRLLNKYVSRDAIGTDRAPSRLYTVCIMQTYFTVYRRDGAPSVQIASLDTYAQPIFGGGSKVSVVQL